MAPAKELTVQSAKPKSASPYQLDDAQTIRASRALLKHLSKSKSESKPNMLEDEDEEDTKLTTVAPQDIIWLVVTGKKFISDKNLLKPHRIPIPHPFSPPSSVLLLVKDPQRAVKDMIPLFPEELQGLNIKVIGLGKLKKKYKSYEARRLLNTSYDKVLADDRIIPSLPAALGKVFYKSTAKTPIPIKMSETPAVLANEISKALKSTYVQISASATTSIRVGTKFQTPEQLQENVSAVVAKVTEKNLIPQGWRGLKALHIKSTESIALPIWLVDQVYDEEDVVTPEQIKEKEAADAAKKAERLEKKMKRKAIRQEIEADRKGIKKVKTSEEAAPAVEAPAEAMEVDAAPVEEKKEEKPAKKSKKAKEPSPEPEIVAEESSEEEEETPKPAPKPVKEKPVKEKTPKKKEAEKPAKKTETKSPKAKKREAEDESRAKKTKKNKSK